METVLYSYSFDWTQLFKGFILLAVGYVFFSQSLSITKAMKCGSKVHGFHTAFFKFAGYVVGPVCLVFFLMYSLGLWAEHEKIQRMLETDQLYTVEGYVENFHPMPYQGHDTEHFEIDGVYFEYSDYDATHNGYHTTSSHGGVIKRNGQYLRLKYITTGENENIILYIAEAVD